MKTYANSTHKPTEAINSVKRPAPASPGLASKRSVSQQKMNGLIQNSPRMVSQLKKKKRQGTTQPSSVLSTINAVSRGALTAITTLGTSAVASVAANYMLDEDSSGVVNYIAAGAATLASLYIAGSALTNRFWATRNPTHTPNSTTNQPHTPTSPPTSTTNQSHTPINPTTTLVNPVITTANSTTVLATQQQQLVVTTPVLTAEQQEATEFIRVRTIYEQYLSDSRQYMHNRNPNEVPNSNLWPNFGLTPRNVPRNGPFIYNNYQNYLPSGSGQNYNEYQLNPGVGATGAYREVNLTNPSTITPETYRRWVGYNFTHRGQAWMRAWNNTGNYWEEWDMRNGTANPLPGHMAVQPVLALTTAEEQLAKRGMWMVKSTRKVHGPPFYIVDEGYVKEIKKVKKYFNV